MIALQNPLALDMGSISDKGYTETNSYDENDEFGYFYVNPYMNWIMFRPNEWNPEQLPEVN